MEPNPRACVAYIVARLVSPSGGSAIYDYSRSKYIQFSGTIAASGINIYDYSRGCFLAGSLSSLYDHGRKAYISIMLNGNHFTGYDYADKKHFSGHVDGKSVTLYDHSDGKYYRYST